MTAPVDCTVIVPTQIQAANTTTPNGVATSLVVLGTDGNLYFTQITVPTLNPGQGNQQQGQTAQIPWTRLSPIVVPTAFVDYPYPSGAGGNTVNSPYQTFKIQGQS